MTDQIINTPSPNYNARRGGKKAEMLVLHYTGMTSAEAALDRLCDPTSNVSAHYLVTEQGQVYGLVDEKDRAWHAGVGCWRGETDINSASIGIEIVNPGHEFGYVPFPKLQMQAVIDLSRKIVTRHPIEAYNVIGHSDLAPDRKQDPGELFDWKKLASNGVGIWVTPDVAGEGALADIPRLLFEIGYELPDGMAISDVITAFQRHWRQNSVTGEIDQETQDLIIALHRAVKRLT
ncbi:MAG: N-acetylmuramoyl-L-alanine amidase [Sneathiella sp.]